MLRTLSESYLSLPLGILPGCAYVLPGLESRFEIVMVPRLGFVNVVYRYG
jgi:hypothetical protein